MEQDFEKKLNTLAYSIEPFAEDETVEFLVETWKSDLNQCEDNLRVNAKELIKNFPRLITSDTTQPIGMPLPISMAAEVYKNEVKPSKFKICDVFRKYLKVDSSELTQIHQFFALKIIVNDELRVLEIFEQEEKDFSESQISECKILHFDEGRPYFDHDIFGEFFVAIFIASRLKRLGIQEPFFKFFVEVLNNDEHRLVRFFLNDIVDEIEGEKKIRFCGNNLKVIFKQLKLEDEFRRSLIKSEGKFNLINKFKIIKYYF